MGRHSRRIRARRRLSEVIQPPLGYAKLLVVTDSRGSPRRAAFLSIRLQADNDLKFGIVQAVPRREPAVDIVSAQEAGLDGVPDPMLLHRAAAEGRVLVSHDRRTMIGHFRDRLASGKSSPGLLIVSQGSAIGEVVEALLYVWALSDPAELRDQAYYLPSISRHVVTRWAHRRVPRGTAARFSYTDSLHIRLRLAEQLSKLHSRHRQIYFSQNNQPHSE